MRVDRNIRPKGHYLASGITRLAECCQTVIPREGFFCLPLPPMLDFSLHTFNFWTGIFNNAVTSFADVRHFVMELPWRNLPPVT